MKRFKNQLIGLFALQCVLVIALFMNNQANTAYVGETPLLSFESSEIDKLRIQQNENTVTLVKEGSEWKLEGEELLPAQDSKVSSVLDKLNDITTTWPIATTGSSHERFEVQKDKHQRRMTLFTGDKEVGDLYIGTSPGFRKVHARVADQDEVFAIGMNTYDLPSQKDSWLDKSLLAVANANEIASDEFTVKNEGGDWQLSDSTIPEDKEFVSSKAKDLASAFGKLKVSKIADDAADELENGEFEKATLRVSGESEHTYSLIKKDAKYFIRRDDMKTLFSISKSDYERLAGLTLNDFLIAKKDETDEADGSDDGSDKASLADSAEGIAGEDDIDS